MKGSAGRADGRWAVKRAKLRLVARDRWAHRRSLKFGTDNPPVIQESRSGDAHGSSNVFFHSYYQTRGQTWPPFNPQTYSSTSEAVLALSSRTLHRLPEAWRVPTPNLTPEETLRQEYTENWSLKTLHPSGSFVLGIPPPRASLVAPMSGQGHPRPSRSPIYALITAR